MRLWALAGITTTASAVVGSTGLAVKPGTPKTKRVRLTGLAQLSSAKRSLPDPLTENDCIACEENLTGLRVGKSHCLNVIDLARTVSTDKVLLSRNEFNSAESRRAQLEAELDRKRQELARVHGRQDSWRSSRLGEVDRLVDSVSLAAVDGRAAGHLRQTMAGRRKESSTGDEVRRAKEGEDPQSEDLVQRWLSCDSALRFATIDLDACFERLMSEEIRLAAREEQYKVAAEGRSETADRTDVQKTVVTDAVTQARGELKRMQQTAEYMNHAWSTLL